MRVACSQERTVTIRISADLLDYMDGQARLLNLSRGQFVGRLLAQVRKSEQDRLAAEGYRFYATEAAAFAEASGGICIYGEGPGV